ncbi:MAG: YraN family protein [Sandaracinaceae bacterium]|nr:YraN family protein [Sandaracinaceae bacterium]
MPRRAREAKPGDGRADDRRVARDERHAARALGARAERIARERLEGAGYEIVEANARVGRAEIDLIARRGALLVFCEVRSRTGTSGPHPLETIDAAKQHRLRRAALAWRLAHGRPAEAVRFDAIAITFEGAEAQIDHVEGAF